MKYEEFPPGKISFGESARLNLSLHYSKEDLIENIHYQEIITKSNFID